MRNEIHRYMYFGRLWETLGDFGGLWDYLLVSWILFSCLLSIPKQMVDNSCLLQSLGLQISAISVGTPTCNPNFKEMDISFDFDYQFIV